MSVPHDFLTLLKGVDDTISPNQFYGFDIDGDSGERWLQVRHALQLDQLETQGVDVLLERYGFDSSGAQFGVPGVLQVTVLDCLRVDQLYQYCASIELGHRQFYVLVTGLPALLRLLTNLLPLAQWGKQTLETELLALYGG